MAKIIYILIKIKKVVFYCVLMYGGILRKNGNYNYDLLFCSYMFILILTIGLLILASNKLKYYYITVNKIVPSTTNSHLSGTSQFLKIIRNPVNKQQIQIQYIVGLLIRCTALTLTSVCGIALVIMQRENVVLQILGIFGYYINTVTLLIQLGIRIYTYIRNIYFTEHLQFSVEGRTNLVLRRVKACIILCITLGSVSSTILAFGIIIFDINPSAAMVCLHCSIISMTDVQIYAIAYFATLVRKVNQHQQEAELLITKFKYLIISLVVISVILSVNVVLDIVYSEYIDYISIINTIIGYPAYFLAVLL